MNALFARFFALASLVAWGVMVATPAIADPLVGRDLLKFSQVPMVNTTVVDTTGQTRVYQGHDEWSTAYGFSTAANPNITSYDGRFMADDFADNFSTPVLHVKWWGSYNHDIINPNFPVNKFLIAFEADVPAPVPGFSTPGAVLQSDVVNRAAVISAAGSGEFTEKLIRGPDPILGESLYEYNAELHLGREFFEQKDTVYWLKIVALVDVPGIAGFPPPFDTHNPPTNMTQWGWHNRDYTVNNPLASPVPLPGETMSVNPADGAPVWHFQDDAVTGSIRYDTTLGIPNFGIFQPPANMQPTNYLGNGIDGASSVMPGAQGIESFSKDLAFELYTVVPEPGTCLLLLSGVIGLAIGRRRA
jgi:hypothetical protein